MEKPLTTISERLLAKSVWGLSALSLAALLLTRELGILTVTAVLTLSPVLYYFDLKGRLGRARWLENALILLNFAVAAGRFFYLKDSFLLIVADFLVFFLLLKCGFKKERGDCLQMIYLSFFALVSCSTLSLDFTFLLSFIIYVLALSWTLSIYVLSEPSDGAAASTESPDAPQKTLRRIRQNAGLTLALALVFAVGIFVFFPRFSLAVFQGAFLGPVHQSGFTEKVELQKSGRIFKDSKVVMRVQIDGDGSPAGEGFLYLRGQALSSFDGRAWTAGKRQETRMDRNTYKTRALKMSRLTENRFQISPPREGPKIRQKIFLESVDTSLLFAAPRLESLTAKFPGIVVYDDGSVSRPAGFKGRAAYQAVSSRGGEQTPGPADDEEIERNLAVPQNSGKIADLGGKIFSRRDSSIVKARKIERHLRESYRYTLDLQGAIAENPLEDFLFVSKEGHCEYFASAMALLLRTAGIPARMATGFLMDEMNTSGSYYIVRGEDAHAWVEGLVDGAWARFDPTPRATRFEADNISLWARARQEVDRLNFLWIYHVLGYDQEYQQRVAVKVASKLDPDLTKIRSKLKFPWKKALAVLGFASLAMVFWKFMPRLESSSKQGKTRASARFYKEMLDALAKRGHLKADGETPNEFAMRIEPVIPGASDDVKAITDVFCNSRYGNLQLNSDRMSQIHERVKTLKSNLFS
ncbi:MAG: hypothetical protein A2901_02515 [Elusimicrobia bacterium RIFCSPLOWO2_01_FULL_54_10]|nr:MAG: hypothetical protein A2901_02515 [Elusimicrobia bacterium RIFCSPLOWO2_01_FULL_54_10]